MTDDKQYTQELPPTPDFSLRGFAPNFVTLLAAASGITAIRFSHSGNWRLAALSILVACVFDGLDGRVARALGVSSKLGAELDSLSDFVCFGVAPAMMMYFRLMELRGTEIAQSFAFLFAKNGSYLWALALFYALCCGYRLARFNIMLEAPSQPYWSHFFTGLPAPGGALLLLLPLLWELHAKCICPSILLTAGCISLVLCGALMASRVPTISLKKLSVSRRWAFLFAILALFIIGMLVTHAWLTLFAIGVVYYVSIPICILVFLHLKNKTTKQ